MRTSAAFIAFAAASAVSAQSSGNYSSSLDMKIDPNSVSSGERASWCQAQTNTCNTLCDNDTKDNGCIQSELSYDCTCSSNNSAPGLQYYLQTLPTFICNELYSQCIKQNVGDQNGQKDCKDDIQSLCGSAKPVAAASSDDDDDDEDSSSTTSGTATATATSSTSGSTATDSEQVTSTSSDGLAAPTMAPMGGAAALAIGLVAYLV